MVDVMTRGRLAGALLLVGFVAVAQRPGAGLASVVDGAWVVAQATLNGELRTERTILNSTWTFRGDELVVQPVGGARSRWAPSFVMRRSRIMLRRLGAMLLALAVAACGHGAMRASPDNVLTVDGLTPNVKDKDAGLVAIAPGFGLDKYKFIAVDTFAVTDPAIEDDDDHRFVAKMTPVFRIELVLRLRDSQLFEQVVDAGELQAAPGSAALRLEGVITRLGRGNQTLRTWVGGSAGAAHVQAELRFVDVASGQVVMATADRRTVRGSGSSTQLVEESFDDMARDLAKFLVRLSKGEAPRD
jgi:Domain of unknown function (DUF4410)